MAARPPRREFLARAALVLCAVALALLVAELALRLAPIPGVHRFSARFDPAVGFTLYPHSLVIYRGPAGQRVSRRTNSLGFLDREHDREKPAGVFRVGFYGDSYVEARQVPDEKTFIRITERSRPALESFALGRSGYGTLISYLNSTRWTPWFDLDLVVYVFCENDPGDNVREIKREPNFPAARAEGEGFRVDYPGPRRGARARVRAAAQVLLAHSVLRSTVGDRLALLADRGVRVRADERERAMATAARAGGGAPEPNDLPSTWPPRWRAEAERVAEAILRAWRDETLAAGREFALLYIPRETELGKGEREDSWKPWLEPFCRANGIPFVDPTPEFLALRSAGTPAFADHFTPAGHEAFAEAFLRWMDGRHVPASAAPPGLAR